MNRHMPIDWTPDRRRAALRSAGIAAVCVAFVAVVLSSLHVHYTTNDDTGIIGFIVEGRPVPYEGIVLTSLLHALYSAQPGFAWFGWCLYALLTLSLFAWITLAWRVFRGAWGVAVIVSFVIFACYLRLVVSLDFTATSVMLGMSGVAWTCVLVVGRHAGSWRYLGAGALFMLGGLVRPEAAFGVLAYGLPAAVIVLIVCSRVRPLAPEFKRLALVALLFLSPAALNFGVDAVWRAAVRTPQEARFEAFNRAGGRFDHLSRHRRIAASRAPGVMASIHWTHIDFVNFYHFLFLDERIYTPEALDTLWMHAPTPRLSWASLGPVVKARLPPRNMVFTLMAASVPLFFLLLLRRRVEGVAGILVPVYGVALTVYMYTLYAFAVRVEMPFEMGLGFLGLLLAGALLGAAGLDRTKLFIPAACLCLAVALPAAAFSIGGVLGSQEQDEKTTYMVQQSLNTLNQRFPGAVVLMQPVYHGLNELSPLRPLVLRFQPINLGWNTFSPRFYDQIQAAGAQHGYELIDAMVDNPHAYVLGTRRWCNKLLVFVHTHDRAHIRVVRVAGRLYQLRSISQAGP